MVLLGLASSAAAAKTETFGGSTSVTVVEIPIQVLDKDGEPVRGLTADDFEVIDGRTSREIISFEVYDRGQPEADTPLPTAARRHFLFLFDLTFSEPTAIVRARGAAIDMLDHLHPSDLVSVATYSRAKGPQLLMAFTPDRRQAELAILGLGSPKLLDRNPDPLQLIVAEVSAQREAQQVNSSAQDQGSGPAGGGVKPDLEAEVLVYLQEMNERAGRSTRRNEEQYVQALTDSMADLATLMRAVDGHKHVLYLSEGFDGQLLRGAETVDLETRLAAESGEIWNVDSDKLYGSGTLQNRMETMLEEFRRADCTIHSIDIASLRGVTAGGSRHEGLTAMAKSTGGELLRNFNDLGKAMDKVLDRTSVTYVLSIQPDDVKADGKYRKLKVRLKDSSKGTRVESRGGYFAPGARALNPMEQRLRTASQLLTGRTGGQLGLSVLAAPFRVPGEQAAVPVLVEIDGANLLDSAPAAKTIDTEIFVYAIDAEGGLKGHLNTQLSFDRKLTEEKLRAGGVKFYGDLALDPGSYEIRVLVRNMATGASGLQSTSVRVPDFENGELAILPPLVPNADNRWMVLRQALRPGDREVEMPFVIGDGQAFVPEAHPVAPSGGVAPIAVFVYHQAGEVSLDAQLLDASGEVALGQQLTVSREEPGEGGLTRILAGLNLAGVAEGEYTLVLGVSETVGAGRELSSIPFKVEGFVEGAAAPSAVDQQAQAEEQNQLRRSQRAVADRIQSQYREALAALADNRDAEATRLLMGLESAFAEKSKDVELKLLRRALMEVASRDLARRADSLIPVAELHFEAYQHYLAERQMLLALHSRLMVQELARLYQSAGEPPESLHMAARVLTSLGGTLQQAGATASANFLFDEVLDFAPGNEAALLGLAAFHEKVGNYEKARDYLAQLVKTNPDNAEGWLRYALNLERCDQKAQAREWLNRARKVDEPVWVQSLAFQELARLEMQEGALNRAEALLREGIEELPGEQRLYLQLAMVLDRTGRGAEATRMIGRMGEVSATGDSARYAYNRWPRSIIELGRRQLKETAQSRRSVLAVAMRESMPAGGGR